MEAIKDDSDADDVGFSSFNASKMGDKWKKDRPAGGARAHRVTGMDKRSGASEQEAAAIRTDDDDF
ncbi:unnamed protein product [Protopolystoma xenopodis]|uniref:Uncharacterized protein n=1 Tax=Protopolystoma xenopodis TaxID=117903 RepID=A0A448X3A1_9PLAT|nr:unnamed protein product [Protopolystoma xenopodis]